MLTICADQRGRKEKGEGCVLYERGIEKSCKNQTTILRSNALGGRSYKKLNLGVGGTRDLRGYLHSSEQQGLVTSGEEERKANRDDSSTYELQVRYTRFSYKKFFLAKHREFARFFTLSVPKHSKDILGNNI